jgi:two-component system chemotaxis response regulator CheY
MKLLIVDDSNMIRTRIASLMRDSRLSGVEIAGLARDGVSALRLAIQEKPDLMTLDLTMPEMDGIACLDAVMKVLPTVSVLVVSALDDKPTAIKALKLGARGFIRKPFTDEQLVQAFLQLIDRP